ncbi:Dihydroorotate dehydrogenase (quinone), mitochondrial [Linum perenne]
MGHRFNLLNFWKCPLNKGLSENWETPNFSSIAKIKIGDEIKLPLFASRHPRIKSQQQQQQLQFLLNTIQLHPLLYRHSIVELLCVFATQHSLVAALLRDCRRRRWCVSSSLFRVFIRVPVLVSPSMAAMHLKRLFSGVLHRTAVYAHPGGMGSGAAVFRRFSSSSASSETVSKIPHLPRKGRLLSGGFIGLVIAGGAYVSTVDEATFCGWLFDATKLVNPFFALLDPETAHRLAVSAAARGWVPREKRPDPPILELEVWGRKFSNPVGLAAGFDKNAEAVEGLLAVGFGFIEVGSVTPVPQEGNPKPRIFRLREQGAIINRCGFNSEGIVAVAKRLGAQHGKRKLAETSSTAPPSSDDVKQGGKAGPGILGVNLGKNKTSEDAASDYVQGVHTLSQYADYLVINVSSPNTPGLRTLQGRKQLKDLVKKIQAARDEMQWGEEGPPPLLVKIAPDLSKEDLEDIAAVAVALRLDGLGKIPLIGCGGVSSGEDAYKKIRAGATLVQLYTSFAYGGPALIPRIKVELAECLERDGFKSVIEAVGADHR